MKFYEVKYTQFINGKSVKVDRILENREQVQSLKRTLNANYDRRPYADWEVMGYRK